MNLLEHYIIEIISESTIQVNGNQYIKVIAIINCYGVEERTETIFTAKEWEKVKEQGYYLA